MTDLSTISQPGDGEHPVTGGPRIHRVAMLTLDAAGTVQTVDGAAEVLLGADARGRPLEEVTAPDHRPALREALTQVERDRCAVRIELTLAADRHPVPAELTLTPTPPTVTVTLHASDALVPSQRILAATRIAVAEMVGADSPTDAIGSVLGALGSLMDCAFAGCWVRTLDGDLERIAAWSADPAVDADAALAGRLRGADGIVARALAGGEAQWSPGDQPLLAARDRLPDADPPAGGLLVLPTTHAGEPTGLIGLVTRHADAPDGPTLSALSLAGAQIGEVHGVLVGRHELVETLSRLALTDELTGLPNRRAWEEAVRRELARAVRDGHAVCIAVIDLDNFKRFNDEHGHQAGDRALAASARAWQAQLRTSDVLARYGGEEFAALIPAWPMETAFDVVERVRLATAPGLTASAGVAGWDGAETGEELFGRADAALYEAKQSGRDRTVSATAPTPAAD